MMSGVTGRCCIHLGKVNETLLSILNGEVVVDGDHVGHTTEVKGSKHNPSMWQLEPRGVVYLILQDPYIWANK